MRRWDQDAFSYAFVDSLPRELTDGVVCRSMISKWWLFECCVEEDLERFSKSSTKLSKLSLPRSSNPLSSYLGTRQHQGAIRAGRSHVDHLITRMVTRSKFHRPSLVTVPKIVFSLEFTAHLTPIFVSKELLFSTSLLTHHESLLPT